MNRHLHSPTQLTEFAREFEEQPDTLFGKFVNRLTNVYNNSYNSVNEVQPGKGLVHSASGSEVTVLTSDAGQRRSTETTDVSPVKGLAVRSIISPEADNVRSGVSSGVPSGNVSNEEASSSSGDRVIFINN